jgi:hypothetical protein
MNVVEKKQSRWKISRPLRDGASDFELFSTQIVCLTARLLVQEGAVMVINCLSKSLLSGNKSGNPPPLKIGAGILKLETGVGMKAIRVKIKVTGVFDPGTEQKMNDAL